MTHDAPYNRWPGDFDGKFARRQLNKQARQAARDELDYRTRIEGKRRGQPMNRPAFADEAARMLPSESP